MIINKAENLIKKLDWDGPVEEQCEAINELVSSKNIEIVMRAKKEENLKENCAFVLSQFTDEELRPYFLELLKWLKDESIPGFFIIHERLQDVKGKIIKKDYQACVKLAKSERNEKWLEILETIHFQ